VNAESPAEAQCRSEIRRPPQGSGPFAVENPIRRPEKRPAGGWSVISTGPSSAMRPHRFVTPCGLRRLRDVFPSVARSACSRVFFANGPEPCRLPCANFRSGSPALAGRRHAAKGERLRAAGRARQSGNGGESARNRRRSRTTAVQIGRVSEAPSRYFGHFGEVWATVTDDTP
jgi:hypothetical protein